MTSMEYGRHARRILEWDEVDLEAEAEQRAPVDLTHGSVFHVDEEKPAQKDSLLGSMMKIFKNK